jgi:iron complex transport system substrate-binding protein
MRRMQGRLACWLLLIGCLAAVGQPAAQTAPRRIISLVPAVTEMLFALGAGDRVVGVSSFDKFPPEIEKVPRVGALLDPNLDRILSLKPDLVVIYHTQTDLQAQLQRATIASYFYRHQGLADVTQTIRSIGGRVGHKAQGDRLASDIESRLAAMRQRFATGARPRALVVFSREKFALRGIYASGGRGFIDDMLTVAGGDNVFADVQREAVQATTELILARRPDVIIELRADPMTPDEERRERTTWNQLAAVPAVRTGRVHIITDPRTVIPGPRVVEGVEVIAERLHRRR